MEDLHYLDAARQRKVEYSQRCDIESRKFCPENYYLAYEFSKKALELLQFMPAGYVSDSCCTRIVCTMVSASIGVKCQQEALSMATCALWTLKTIPHLVVHLAKDGANALLPALKKFGIFFMDVKKFEEAIWCFREALIVIEENRTVLNAEVHYALGVALLKLAESDAKGSCSPLLLYKSKISEAIVKLKRAAKLFNSLNQLQPNEDFLVAETDCYFYLEKACYWNEEFDHAHNYSQKILAFKNMYPKEMIPPSFGWHRRASWSEVTEQLQNAESSCSEGTRKVEQGKVKQKLR